MTELRTLLEIHKSLVTALETVGHLIGEKVCAALRPFIPTIYYTIGWEEGGPDVICFRAEKDDPTQQELDDYETYSRRQLHNIFWELEDELQIQLPFDTPFGLSVPEEHRDEIKKVLRELLVGEKE